MKNNKRAFLLLELLIAIALISTIFVTLFFLQSKLLQIKQDGIMKVRATYYAEEGIEALRVIRVTSGWQAISGLDDDDDYYISLSNNQWLVNTVPVTPDAPSSEFTRVIKITGDDNKKKVTVTVRWGGGAKSVVLDTYLTNWTSNL